MSQLIFHRQQAVLESIWNDALFDQYDITKEPYYIERDQDRDIIKSIDQIGTWVYGPPGSGKSNLILRNLIKTNRPFIPISLGACIGMDIESFFREILYELAVKMGDIKYQIQPANFSQCVRGILTLLENGYKNKELVIYIEEVPISTTDEYKIFSEKFFSLLSAKNLVTGLDKVKFVLSSIQNPAGYIRDFQQKIHEQVRFFPLKYWPDEEIGLLVRTITPHMTITVGSGFFNEIITAAKGSPRFVKKFYRSVHMVGKDDELSLKTLLKETERDLSQLKNV